MTMAAAGRLARWWPMAASAAAMAAILAHGSGASPSPAQEANRSDPAPSAAPPPEPETRGPSIPAHRAVVAPLPARDVPPDDLALVSLGRAIFSDERLSDPAGTSCASCHDPTRAFAGDHGSDLGVPRGSRPGHFARRATPSVLYMRYVPAFHYFEDDEAPAPSPYGGFFWDGRSDAIARLVEQPIFNPDEMNAGDPQRVAAKIAGGPYAGAFGARFGALSDAKAVMRGIGAALEAYLKSDEMTPASSKYDAYVRGEATLTPQEKRGLEAFKDPLRGACVGCHRMNETSTNPARSMFTDYGFDAVGVPRNRALPGSRDPRSFDLGLCERKDARTPSSDPKWCGSFRTPSLRNVAVRETFMHNGAFRSLRDVVVFYATRATNPGRWYPPGTKFDDLPEKYRDNVNIYNRPYNGREGGTPPMDDDDIDAIVAFLGTLTDAAYLRAQP